MPEYDFQTYPTTPDAMAKYLQEREAAGNPMTGEEALAYSDWSREYRRAIQERIDARKTPEEREEFRRFAEEFERQCIEDEKRSAEDAGREAAEDAERAAQGKRPIKRERDIVTPEGFSGIGVTSHGW